MAYQPYILEAMGEEGTSNDTIQTAVGIDIGTSHCSIAIWRDSAVHLLRNSADRYRLPANILFRGDNEPAVGTTSEQDLLSGSAIFNVKRLLGRLDTDPVLMKSVRTSPFYIQSLDLGVRPFLGALGDKVWRSTTPEEVLAILLVKLKAMAEADLGRPVLDAVVTVPVAFTRFQLTRMERACAMAGLRVLRLMPEPTAVALLYAQKQLGKLAIVEEFNALGETASASDEKGSKSAGQPVVPAETTASFKVEEIPATGGETVQQEIPESAGVEKLALIFNMGAGHTDVALTATCGGVSQIKAVFGDVIGGEDLVWNLVDHVTSVLSLDAVKDLRTDLPEAGGKTVSENHANSEPDNVEPDENLRQYGHLPEVIGRLKFACERAMEVLSTEQSTEVIIPDGSSAAGEKRAEVGVSSVTRRKVTITRNMFEEVNAAIFDRCSELVRLCFEAAQVRPEAVGDVVLAGGCSAIPKIRSVLESIMQGQKFYAHINSLEAAVTGAALEGAITSGLSESSGALDLLTIQAVPLSLGIEGEGGEFVPVLPRNNTIPARKEIVVTTTKANQAEALIVVYEGENKVARNNHLLGFFKVSGIPAAAKGVPLISVSMDVDASNVLRVVAGVYLRGSASPQGNVTEVRMPTVDDGQAWCSDAIAKKFQGSLDVTPVRRAAANTGFAGVDNRRPSTH